MDISPIAFLIFAVLATVCSLAMVFKKNPVTSAFNLILVFFCFAGIYALLQAHFMAAIQILVYAGAIMVLFVFVIMLLNADIASFDLKRSSLFTKGLAVLGALAFFLVMTVVFRKTAVVASSGQFTTEHIDALGGNTQVLSETLFSTYLLPFELTSLLLLAAIVGTVIIAKRKKKPEVAHG